MLWVQNRLKLFYRIYPKLPIISQADFPRIAQGAAPVFLLSPSKVIKPRQPFPAVLPCNYKTPSLWIEHCLCCIIVHTIVKFSSCFNRKSAIFKIHMSYRINRLFRIYRMHQRKEENPLIPKRKKIRAFTHGRPLPVAFQENSFVLPMHQII